MDANDYIRFATERQLKAAYAASDHKTFTFH